MTQEAPAARDVHVSWPRTAKSNGSAPPRVTVVTDTVVLLGFVNMTPTEAEMSPRVVAGNCTVVGEAERRWPEICADAVGVDAPAPAAPPRMGSATSVRRLAMATRRRGRFVGEGTRPH